ncbi:hypothetical protein FA95DRAFT_405685 [Auriscalpium vulgare]|uniref:Uncharacterized protein n=1 Tax=Auriscalpium vulgare TaxID=40419 RepID=A0ACB8RGX1_9AGAM|nr:hypothetical protein FA95DRAFT_405685 [Auriscalpium vulgare]
MSDFEQRGRGRGRGGRGGRGGWGGPAVQGDRGGRGGGGRGRAGRGRGFPAGPAVAGSHSPSASTPPGEQSPRGVCKFYWTTGRCQFSFDCTFKHEKRSPLAQSSVEPVDEPDFFSTEGLAVNNGSIVHETHTLNPSAAHNHLKAFLFDHYEFRGPANVAGFSRIFASINDRNKSWTSDHAQAFLDTIVHGNALFRIGDVLRFEPVSSAAGTGFSVLPFQLAYFPLFEYMASDLVLKSTMHENINALYTVLERNYAAVHKTTRDCMQEMIARKTWHDPTPGLPAARQNTLDGVAVFKTLTTLLSQLFQRFKQVIRNHPELQVFVNDVHAWFQTWSSDVSSPQPRFQDPITSSTATVRKLTLDQLEQDVSRLKEIVDRECGVTEQQRRPIISSRLTPAAKREALMNRLAQTYDPPGDLRDDGVRHDNDFPNIAHIRIAPTHQELLSPVPPYLPIFDPEARHHLPARSMERHLDVQFRLLREELISSLRQSLIQLQMDLAIMWERSRPRSKANKTTLEDLLAKKGGSYRTSGVNSVFFHMYTNIRFAPVKAERRSFTIGLTADTPPGPPRDPSAKKRSEYWEHSKRLQQGSLVALVLISRNQTRVYLGTIVSQGSKDIAESAKASKETIQFRASFFDAEVELMALRREPISVDSSKFAILVDNNIMYESIRPFLEALQTVEPTSIPFARFISHGSAWGHMTVQPPRYARVPGFRYNLQCLAPRGRTIQSLNVQDLNSVEIARGELNRFSSLDRSQVDAVLDALQHGLSLIQGPPGTGKSFTGKELLRVLFASKIKPIVLIAFTNHALDHMVTSVLDAGITTKIVRLGSRASDERIAEYSLDKLERLAQQTDLSRAKRREYGAMRKLEEDMTQLMESIQLPRMTWAKIEEFLDIHHLAELASLQDPPYWISELYQSVTKDEEEHGEWTEVASKKQKKAKEADVVDGIYGFWKLGKDIEFIEPRPAPVVTAVTAEHTAEPEKDPRTVFFESLGFEDGMPPVPSLQRTTDELIYDVANVWSMSRDERRRLSEYWEEEIRAMAYSTNLAEFESLRADYKKACKRYNEVNDEARRQLLSQTELIACTTTGAAKLVSLLTSIAPKVLMVEEAGQVLESHILSALVPSVEHLICIGDPQQLRPTLATFSLSVDSASGAELYKFDRSLMERLAVSGFPMSQINVQRRMRPSISHFIRKILYPKLEDNAVVRDYPPVQGMEQDVFFFTHDHQENGEADSVSKFNMFEVNMIRDLVLYFLRQGPYNGAGDIAVLCAYLGQLQKVRAALRDLKIAVAVDERDEDELERQGLVAEAEEGFDQVAVAKHIRLGTVDTFQGEEAKIVIVSLVRNTGAFEESQSIGFLKSSNRINVALSRAKHGMYILGNASNLRRNATWTTVLDEMEDRGLVGYGFPAICPRHPEKKTLVTQPGQLDKLAPEGGCLSPCNFRLSCGHTCPSVCHTDLDNHRRMRCNQPCPRVTCPRSHPCPLLCSDNCGDCKFPMYDVQLPCGHIARQVPCYMLEDLASVACTEKVTKKLPHCEHSTLALCSKDPASIRCQAVCGGMMACCSRACKSRCHDCQKVTSEARGEDIGHPLQRTHHQGHPCERVLKCQHLCGLNCSEDHQCNSKCLKACRQRCTHQGCSKPCWEPCPPCMEPCGWICPHEQCPVLCGSICSRLPCDEPCEKPLACGHPCPSVCGEPCGGQACVTCLAPDRKAAVVDFIMQRTLEDVDPWSGDPTERLITLECGHIFTVETLDGHCHMSDYYEVDAMTGGFLQTKAPPTDYQTPPSCPTCRGPITALRYGRVTKRATLDILEQNVASSMSSSLDSVSPEIERLTARLPASQEAAKKIPYSIGFKVEPEFTHLLQTQGNKFGREYEPLPHSSLTQGSMVSIHGLAAEEAKIWQKVVGDFVKVYRKVADVATIRGPQSQAYDAALSTLYRLELNAIAQDPARATAAPEPLAMKEVNRKIGQPPHKADTRFQIEAFFLSLELRFSLAQIATSRIEGMSGVIGDARVLQHKRIWRCFVDFVYKSCVLDAKKAYVLANKCSASRLQARAAVHNLRAELEQFRFGILGDRDEILKTGRFTSDQREELASRIRKQQTYFKKSLETIEKTYLRSRPATKLSVLMEERTWFSENCREKAQKYIEEYDNLAEHILHDSAYAPLSLQEREDIVKAFGFSHRGHFYNCQNGHTFVITECGGAMEASRCPECGAPIGGTHHNINSSNTRAMEFEELAGRQGSATAPWPWARGA